MAEPICKFTKLREYLRSQGIYVEERGAYRKIKPGDVTFDTNKKVNIVFNDNCGNDGVFVIDDNGNYHQVFLYKRDYNLPRFGKPKAHICKCETIDEFIYRGQRDAYRYANTDTVPVANKANGYIDEDVSNLPICKNCIKMLNGKYLNGMTTTDFVEILKQAGEMQPDEFEVDINGYVKGWDRISWAYRTKHNFTCENCGWEAKNNFDRRLIQVHHINGSKVDNIEANLKCLCVRCHSQMDSNHQENFSKGVNKKELDEFIEKHLTVKDEISIIRYCKNRVMRHLVDNEDGHFNKFNGIGFEDEEGNIEFIKLAIGIKNASKKELEKYIQNDELVVATTKDGNVFITR